MMLLLPKTLMIQLVEFLWFNDNKHVIFWQQSVANKPEFDGRFFVKILGDQATETFIKI